MLIPKRSFLGIDGLIGGDGAGDEGGDLSSILDADDGERVGVERGLPGILGGAGFAFGGARTGGFAGIGLVGGDAIGGGCHRSSCSMAEAGWSAGGCKRLGIKVRFIEILANKEKYSRRGAEIANKTLGAYAGQGFAQ